MNYTKCKDKFGGVDMSLTPMDIHNKEFPLKMRGYDQDEVNDYLDQIIKELEKLVREKKEMEKQLSFAEEKLTHYDSLQDSLNRSILVAQEAADRLKENTAKEVEVILREAENNADQLLKDSVEKAQRIEVETEELRKHSKVFRQRLQLMIESQLEMLKKDDWDEVLRMPEVEKVSIPTIQEISQKLTDEENSVQLDENEEVQVETTETDNELDSSSDRYEEGMTPAVELPTIENE